MKKLILRWFLPSASQIADMVVKVAADFINNSDKTELIAKYGTYANDFTKIQAKVTAWLRDGKLDDAEKQEFYNAILPLAQKLIEEIKR